MNRRKGIVARSAAVVSVSWAVILGCSSSSTIPRAKLEGGCSINSDCNAPLVCAFSRCHTECKDSARDCPAGQRCVAGERPFRVCQLEIEKACKGRADCADGKLCGPDGQCRDECSVDADCGSGQLCRSAVCAEQKELVDDRIPATAAPDAAPTGQPCQHAHECPGVQICSRGFCAYECVTDKDCFVSWSCQSNRCYPPDGGVVP